MPSEFTTGNCLPRRSTRGKRGRDCDLGAAVTERGFQYPAAQANGANILAKVWEFSNALAIAEHGSNDPQEALASASYSELTSVSRD
ncbi:unnamed protein product [Lasius platythorax]|uniref:Uncharacterized protein n=1 Tax=Lasius platythorax TaxID=488582 RepID=A0AAV2NAP9_9HYME